MSARVIDYAFLRNLEDWVRTQKRVLETFRNYEKEIEASDRLNIVVATRAAFQHMMRTIKAFDNWLQDPVIVAHLPREMLVEVWKVMYEVLQRLLEIDIKHTSEVRELLEKLVREGKLNPHVAAAREQSEGEEEGRRPPTMMI